MKKITGILSVLAFILSACAHSGNEQKENSATQTGGASENIRKRAAFDLGCPEAEIQVSLIQKGTFVRAATYGATCGDKRVSYLERMGTIIKQ